MDSSVDMFFMQTLSDLAESETIVTGGCGGTNVGTLTDCIWFPSSGISNTYPDSWIN